MTPWARWRVKRRIGVLLDPGEDLEIAERLYSGGWWAMTDRALYVMNAPGHPARLSFAQIRSIQTRGMAGTIAMTDGHVIMVNLRPKSALAKRLPPFPPQPSRGS